jgi:hypothetical protein
MRIASKKIKGYKASRGRFRHLFQDRVRDGADQAGGDVDPIELAQRPLDLAGGSCRGHPSRRS